MKKSMLFLVVILFGTFCQCQSNFEIIYLADPVIVGDLIWLNKIKTDWHATGINLRIRWTDVGFSRYDWTNVDRALFVIDSAKLGIYIRVSMNTINASWYNNFIEDDYQHQYDGSYYLNPYYSGRRMLNFVAHNARIKQAAFFSSVVRHLNTSPYSSKIRLVVPAISSDDESEYTSHTIVDGSDVMVMEGYSTPEIDAFVYFLSQKYIQIQTLNNFWGSNFDSFKDVKNQMSVFGWQVQPNKLSYTFNYPRGRKDWIDCRTKNLKSFLDTLASITKAINPKFKFGLQFGSLYDGMLPLRGFYDPTSLLEKVDYFITSEIVQYKPNFKFAADYGRSLGRYWDWRNNRDTNKIKFATESNWPDYNSYKSVALCTIWKDQMESFYDRGASALFISHWGTTDLAESKNIHENIKNGNYMRPDRYLSWSQTLAVIRPIRLIANHFAVHLSCELGLWNDPANSHCYTYGELDPTTPSDTIDPNIPFYQFPFVRFIVPRAQYNRNSHYSGTGDIVNNYMIQNSPRYLTSLYDTLCLTASSYFLPDSAYVVLVDPKMQKLSIVNSTWFSNAGLGDYAFIPGIKNEYNVLRFPMQLILKTKPDIQNILPNTK